MTTETFALPSPGVTAAAGFRASGVTAGLKASGRPDLALVVNDGPSQVAAAVFTTNRVRRRARWSGRGRSSRTAS